MASWWHLPAGNRCCCVYENGRESEIQPTPRLRSRRGLCVEYNHVQRMRRRPPYWTLGGKGPCLLSASKTPPLFTLSLSPPHSLLHVGLGISTIGCRPLRNLFPRSGEGRREVFGVRREGDLPTDVEFGVALCCGCLTKAGQAVARQLLR